jgi:DNA-binding winged helix-turn-helix (wHTH) protein
VHDWNLRRAARDGRDEVVMIRPKRLNVVMKQAQLPIYRFGDIVADQNRLEVWRGGSPVELEPKALRVLFYLIERREQVVTKEDLIHDVWAGTAVTDNALTRAVAQLRKALDDDARQPRYIETVPTVGYRFLPRLETAAEENIEAKIQPPARKFWARYGIGAGLVLLGLVVAGWWLWPKRPAPRLTGSNLIVLAEFENSTGDPVFDETLRQGLAVGLEQSPHLRLVSEQRIRETIRLLSQPPGARLRGDLANEVCIRAGASAVLEGSIARLGKQYVLTLAARNCPAGEVIFRQQAQAVNKRMYWLLSAKWL